MNEAISGLGALGFWLFLAVLVVAIAWATIRKAQIQQETLNKIIESGQNPDKELIESILSPKKDSQKPYDHAKAVMNGLGFTFLIGFCTAFAGFAWEGGISYPIAGLGVFAILYSIIMGFRFEKQNKELQKQNLDVIE